MWCFSSFSSKDSSVNFSITSFLTLKRSRLSKGAGTFSFDQASSLNIFIGTKSLATFEVFTCPSIS